MKKQNHRQDPAHHIFSSLTFLLHVHLLDFLAIENLDSYFISCENVLCNFYFAKGPDSQCLPQAII